MKVAVVGGGAGGMMAALFAAQSGARTVLIEKNGKLGKKIYITGKGRCNLTNDCPPGEFLENVVSNAKFLIGALHSFSPADCIKFFEDNGLKLKTERGGRVYPESDKASDVIKCLEKCLKAAGVEIMLNTRMTDIILKGGAVAGIMTENGLIECAKAVLSTGGVTYPLTGSDGSGIRTAEKLGHSVIPLKAALCGLITQTVDGAAGLTLKNVKVSVKNGTKELASEFGEMLLTHSGVSGPAVLSLSSRVNRLGNYAGCYVEIDLKPALDEKTLDARLLRDFKENSNKCYANSLDALLPRSLIGETVKRSGIDPLTRVHQITSAQRKNLVTVLKHFKLDLYGLENMETAVVSAGGVNVNEINPSTMESRLLPGLYFAGEMIDCDALTGGFNLQAAFSTGARAGASAAESLKK